MRTLHKVLVGSRLHGLNNEDSDYDYRGFFVVDLVEILSPFRKLQNTSWIEDKVDDTNYELGNFLKMCSTGNPSALEVIWSNQVWSSSDIARELIANRHKLLDDQKVYFAHLGYAENQIKKMDLYNPEPMRTPKTIVAYVRSIRQGAELLETGEFNPVYEYNDKDFLLEVKNNFNSSLIPQVTTLMYKVRQELEAVKERRGFVRKPDIAWLEHFLVDVYSGKSFKKYESYGGNPCK